MTVEERADTLINKVSPHCKYWDDYFDEPLNVRHDIILAIICVDEILDLSYFKDTSIESDGLYKNYWQHVKEELERRLNAD